MLRRVSSSSMLRAQIPQYYSEKTGNSFTDMSVSSSEYLYKKVVLGVIYDSFTETYRFEIIDNGGIDTDYITDHVNSEKNVSRIPWTYSLKPIYLRKIERGAHKSSLKRQSPRFRVTQNTPYLTKSLKWLYSLVANYARTPEYMEKQNLFNFIQVNPKAKIPSRTCSSASRVYQRKQKVRFVRFQKTETYELCYPVR